MTLKKKNLFNIKLLNHKNLKSHFIYFSLLNLNLLFVILNFIYFEINFELILLKRPLKCNIKLKGSLCNCPSSLYVVFKDSVTKLLSSFSGNRRQLNSPYYCTQ